MSSDYESSHELLIKLVKRKKRSRRKLAKLILRSADRKVSAIDPVDCGCTDCCTGRTRPARDDAEYELAQAAQVAR